jgi:hypothetical protein
MSRVIGQCEDWQGEPWDVVEARDCAAGFAVLLGYPSRPDVTMRGRPAIIPTFALVAWLRDNQDRPSSEVAPVVGISMSVLKRLRGELGMGYRDHQRQWWLDRVDDLATLTIEAFAAKHERTFSTVAIWRLKLIGKTNRDAGWWLEEPARSALLSDAAAAEVAKSLGVPVGTVGSLRAALKARGMEIAVPFGERIARSKRGKPAHPHTRRALLKAARRKKHEAWRLAIGNALVGRPGASPRKWTPKEDAMLGLTLDRHVASMTGRTVAAVRDRRHALGIPESRHAKLRRIPTRKN